MEEKTHNVDTGLYCLVIISRLNSIPVDATILSHQYGESGKHFTINDILRAAKSLNLRAKKIHNAKTRLKYVPLPAIAIHNDGHFFIILQVKDDDVLIQDPSEFRSLSLDKSELHEIWTGHLILITRRRLFQNDLSPFNFSWFIPVILKYRRLLAEVLLASFFIQIFALITPIIFQIIIDKVLVHKSLVTLHVLATGLLAVYFFDVILNGLRNYVFSHTTSRIDVELGTALYKHLLKLPLNYFEVRRVGDTVARVRELDTIRNFITGSSITLIIDLLFTSVFFIVMYLYSPELSYIVLAAIPLYIILAVIITPIFRLRLNDKFNRSAENHSFLVETVRGIETIKASAVEPQNQRGWEEQLSNFINASFKVTNLGNIATQIASLINKTTTLLILWVGTHLVIDGELSVGQLVAFNMLAARISNPVLRMVQLWQDFQQAGISVQRLGDIFNVKSEQPCIAARVCLPKLDGQIIFDQVTFRYLPEGPEILKKISFMVNPGDVIGIVGNSGSGKSTLVKLLQRLYVPQAGNIKIDGIDISLVNLDWLRRNIGIVLQDNILFNRSVRENIALIDPALSMARVVQVAKLAGAHDFIIELPYGYDTMIEEHGSNLSGGQRQRIAIARALIPNPHILILDEATSALDYESECIIHRNMRYICKGRTVFIIAHRLSALRYTNHILVIEKGRITEQGNHKKLMENNGYYAKLYAHQVGMVTSN